MIRFIIHNSDGRILRTGLCQKVCLELQAQAGEFVMAGEADDREHYVADGVVTPRPGMTISVDTVADTTTLTGVPVGADVQVSGPAYDAFTATDDVLELTFDAPGVYTIRVLKFPYRDFEAVINAA